ncbi:hypothetical protein [Cytophaga aurantiaca]|uniref:hypothetical protein n=1 Tax=Cytophaga aurantiaca TaxID=29530 RepID=UPI00039F3E2F|nr:hypothetical protein [Cytophaga aurantiaca]
MKNKVVFVLLILPLIFSSWTTDTKDHLNANSWNISIGENVLLASWKNNKMGDVAIFDKTKFKSTDTLFAGRFICGSLGQPTVTTMEIKNYKNEVIKKVVNKNYRRWGTTAYVPLSQIVNLTDFKSGQTISIFLTIDFLDGESAQPMLLGSLKVK